MISEFVIHKFAAILSAIADGSINRSGLIRWKRGVITRHVYAGISGDKIFRYTISATSSQDTEIRKLSSDKE